MEKLNIGNFRNIRYSVEFDLSRINILTGPNNSGKSNVLKMLLLFDDYLNSRNHLVLAFNRFNARKHKIDNFQNAINWLNWKTDKLLRFSFGFDQYNLLFEFLPLCEMTGKRKSGSEKEGRLNRFEMINKSGNKLSFSFKSENEYILTADKLLINDFWIMRGVPEVEDQMIGTKIESSQGGRMKRISGTIRRLYEMDKSDPEYISRAERLAKEIRRFEIGRAKLENLNSRKGKILDNDIIQTVVSVPKESSSSGTLPDLISEGFRQYFSNDFAGEKLRLERDEIKDELWNIGRILKRILKSRLTHMDPDRSDQARIHLYTEKLTDINWVIRYHTFRPFGKGSTADKFIKKWMKAFNIGTNYRIRHLEGIASSMEIKGEYGWRNLVDKGFGTGQVFSLLMRIAEVIENDSHSTANAPPVLIAIEEPEANLHPKYQSWLADVFMDTIGLANVQFIIETHSEYFIRRFQYLVSDKRKKLNNTDIKVLYFQEPDLKQTGTELVYDLEMRPDGMLKKDFGPGFFDEATRLTINLLKQQKNS